MLLKRFPWMFLRCSKFNVLNPVPLINNSPPPDSFRRLRLFSGGDRSNGLSPTTSTRKLELWLRWHPRRFIGDSKQYQSIYLSIYPSIHASIHPSMCAQTHTHCMYACMHVCVQICVCICFNIFFWGRLI